MQIKYYFKDTEGNSRVIQDLDGNPDNIQGNMAYIKETYGAINVLACIVEGYGNENSN